MKLKDATALIEGLTLERDAITTIQSRITDKYDHELQSALKILQIMKVNRENRILEINMAIDNQEIMLDKKFI